MSISHQKQRLRRQFEKSALKYHESQNTWDQSVFDRFFSVSLLLEHPVICIYVSKPDEVTTHLVIKRLHQEGYTIIVPKVQPENQLSLHQISSTSELALGSFGVLEPRENTQTVSPDHIDLFVVPGLYFDLKGNRLGRGPGYYDRLLEHTKSTKLGLAYEWQIVENLPTARHDIGMDMLITNTRTIEISI